LFLEALLRHADSPGSDLPESLRDLVLADALAGWDAAAEAWDHLGQPYPLACALLRAAEAAVDCGSRDGPAERLGRAAPLADGLGLGPLRGQIGSLARRARLGLPAAGHLQSSVACICFTCYRRLQIRHGSLETVNTQGRRRS
jgi:hypothetical protein